MPEYNFSPDPETIVDILKGKETFKTADIRMELAAKGDKSPTNPINRMLVDLKDSGYLSAIDYDTNYNHEWSLEEFSPQDIISEIGEYTFSELSPDTFYEG